VSDGGAAGGGGSGGTGPDGAGGGRDAVVVPAVGSPSSVTAVRSLGRRGVRPVAVGDVDAPAFRSRYCAESIVAPDPTDDVAGYGDALLRIAERGDVRTVLPLREPDVYVLATRRDEFAEHVATPWKPYDTIELVQDRLRLFDVAERSGVAVPDTAPLDEWDRWDEPTVVKSRYSVLVDGDGTGYPGVEFVAASEEPPDPDRVEAEWGHVPIAQEYVPGDAEGGFFALYDRGEPVATFQHRRVRSYTYTGGASVYRESVHDPDLDADGRALLDALDWHGPAMVEVKRDPEGTPKLMEVNPRFWGSLALPVRAGVDFPSLYYELATGGVEQPVHDCETGVGSHVLRGEASYLHSVFRHDHAHRDPPSLVRSLADVARSIAAQPNFDYLSRDDPRPFVADLARFV